SRVRLSFTADLPALGYRTYRLLPEGGPAQFPAVQASDNVLENDRFRLEFDPDTGYIISLFDKQEQIEVFAGPAAKPVVIEDLSDTWSHNTFTFHMLLGTFTCSRVRLVDHGHVQSVYRVPSSFQPSSPVE